MVPEQLVGRSRSWLSAATNTGIVVSSRVRLARNIRHATFPGWAREDERVSVLVRLRDSIQRLRSMEHAFYLDMSSLEAIDRDVLEERHLISRELAEKGQGSGLFVAADERVSIMINEEDHLRLQAIGPGMNIGEVWGWVDSVDSELEREIDYAFTEKLGYLTSCPTNVGTGLRASVMMHLPGLRMTNDVEPVIKGLERIGFAVRGILGEGTEARGNLFQVSNQLTLGETEKGTIERLASVAGEVVAHEENARARLLEDRRTDVLDWIGRAYGILLNARVLSSGEALDLLSALRFGVDVGFVCGLSVSDLNEIMLLTQRGHLQRMTGRSLRPEKRDEFRASIIRERLGNVSLPVRVDGGKDE